MRKVENVTIVVLAWGSLCWDPRKLRIRDGWHDDGPLLPVEFARVSSDGRLTLVLSKGAKDVQVLWAKMDATTVKEAIDNLREREGCEKDKIGYVDLRDRNNSNCKAIPSVLDTIKQWTATKKFDATIWTDLADNFHDETNMEFTEDNVIKYLSEDLDTDCKKRAEEYIRKTPSQIRTKMRGIIDEKLNWTHRLQDKLWKSSDIEKLWTWVQHEDETFMNRANLFVAVESILFATFAALVAINGLSPSFPILLVLVGLIISICWLCVATVEYLKILKPLKKMLRDADMTYADTDSLHQRYPTSWVIGILIPATFLALWLLLLMPHILLSAK